MLDHVPRGARVLVVSGGEGAWRSDLRSRGGEAGAALVESWELRTQISEREAKEWATVSALSARGSSSVWVVFFHDGGLGGECRRGRCSRPMARSLLRPLASAVGCCRGGCCRGLLPTLPRPDVRPVPVQA